YQRAEPAGSADRSGADAAAVAGFAADGAGGCAAALELGPRGVPVCISELDRSAFMPEQPRHCIVAIVPCNDIDASTAFYGRLGLSVYSDYGRYRILTDGKG